MILCVFVLDMFQRQRLEIRWDKASNVSFEKKWKNNASGQRIDGFAFEKIVTKHNLIALYL